MAGKSSGDDFRKGDDFQKGSAKEMNLESIPRIQGWYPLVVACPRRRDDGRVMTAPRRSMTAALVGS
jgi:hypothetical protein